MIPAERQQFILSCLAERDIVSIADLVERLGVSHMTVRRDIQALEEAGRVTSVTGGVRLSRRLAQELPHLQKAAMNTGAKRAVGQAAADLVRDGMVIYLDAGTTLLELARQIAGRRGLTVVTNDFVICAWLSTHSDCTLYHSGGLVERANQSCVGGAASEALARFNYDIAFISTSSWTVAGLSSPSEAKGPVKRVAVDRARLRGAGVGFDEIRRSGGDEHPARLGLRHGRDRCGHRRRGGGRPARHGHPGDPGPRSEGRDNMTIVVTGGAGFLGARLIAALLADGAERIVSLDRVACPVDDARVESLVGSIDDADAVARALSGGADTVYHLAAVLSGQSEEDFDTGLHINVDATRLLLEACRKLDRAPRFVFTSSLAVFGGEMPQIVPPTMALMPQSSYGCGKAIGELLVSEYSRKGFVDGLTVRLPTICVRPGAPNSAASSFVSGIIREPVAGQASECPVPLDTRLWISSPGVAVQNLVRAGRVPATDLGLNRVMDMPGITATPAEMLDSLERLVGPDARARVALTRDQRIIDIVCSWPGAFDVTRARALGFGADTDFDAILRQFLADR